MGDIIDFSQGMADLRREKAEASGPTLVGVTSANAGAAGSTLAGATGTTAAASADTGALVYGRPAHVSLSAHDAGLAVELDLTAQGQAHFVVAAPADALPAAKEEGRKTLARNFGVDPRDDAQMGQLKAQLGQEGYDAFFPMYLQQRFFKQACALTGFTPYLQPSVSRPAMPEEGQDFVFTADALIRPTVELSSYEPVEVEFPEKRAVDTKDITAYLDVLAERFATFEPDLTRSVVEENDHLVITLQLNAEDSAVAGLASGQPQRLSYEMGAGMMPEEFDRTLVGAKVGETRSFSLSMPVPADPSTAADASDAQGEPAAEGTEGQPGVAYEVLGGKVTVNEIDRKVPAVINDAWVMKNAPEAATLLGLRAQVRQILEAQADDEWRTQMMTLCSEKLGERIKNVPGEPYVQHMRDVLLSNFVLDMQRQGLDARAYMSQPGFDHEEFQRQMDAQAEKTLRHDLALDALADHLDIKVADEDVRQIIGRMAPGREAEMMRAMSESGEIDQIRADARRIRASDWLVDHAKDASGPHLQLL